MISKSKVLAALLGTSQALQLKTESQRAVVFMADVPDDYKGPINGQMLAKLHQQNKLKEVDKNTNIESKTLEDLGKKLHKEIAAEMQELRKSM